MCSLLRPLLTILAGASLLGLGACSKRLGNYQDLLVGQSAASTPAPSGREVQITYLGTNGYLIRSRGVAIVLDPYFSRIDTRRVLFNAPVSPDEPSLVLGATMAKFPRVVDAWLVTHAHFDHLFDVPPLAKQYGGKIVTSPTGAFLSEASGTPSQQLLPSLPGKVHYFSGARVTVLSAEHDKALGVTPYPGTISGPLPAPPSRPKDWRMGTPLAFLIEIEGKKIYIESGGLAGTIPSVSNVDLAIVGTATPSSQGRYAEAVTALSPRFVLPSHQDNFLLPLENGFHFSTLANFPKIKEMHETEALPGEMVLMDYFATWSLP